MSFTETSLPFIIAEIGGNHEGDFEYAKKLLVDAAATGANAIKFQTYSADRIVNKDEAPERNKHFSKFELSTAEYVELAEICESLGTMFMTSLWDLESIKLLDPLIKVHKVGSGDLTNYRLLKPLAETDKPLCIATAMATLEETLAAVEFIRSINPRLISSGNLCVMHCVAMYGEPRDTYANLLAIKTLRDNLPPEISVGYSDHTSGNVAVKVALEFGANVIETHFTDDKTRDFRDHHFAHTQQELRDFIEFCSRRGEMLGTGLKRPVSQIESEARIKQFRRACYLKVDLDIGETVSESNLTTLRPLVGLPATEYFNVIGKQASRKIKALEPLSWNDFV